MTAPPSHIGRYRVERLVGAGAYGRVYEGALHGALGFRKRVAIKVLAGDQPGYDARRVERFVTEARVGETLQHPNIVSILEFGEHDGRYFLAMEYVDGISVGGVLSLCRGRGVILPADAVCELGIQVADGLDHAHRAKSVEGGPLGLIHRDIKPANLLLDRTGTVRIGDFGVARAAHDPYFTTDAGVLQGTPAYMAPEQVRGAEPLTASVDVHALGLVLCELATGEPVFPGRRIEPLLERVLASDTGGALARLAERAPELAPVVRRAVEPAPEERWPSAGAMGEALLAVWTRLGTPRRLARVAEATVGLRSREGEGLITAGDTVEVPAVPMGSGGASGWEVFEAAFADRLSAAPRREDIAADPSPSRTSAPDAESSRWSRGRAWGAAMVLLLGLLIVAAILATPWRPTPDATAPEPGQGTVPGVVPPAAREAPVAVAAPPPAREDVPEPEPADLVNSPGEEPGERVSIVPADVEPAPDTSPLGTTPGYIKVNSRPWSQV